MKKAYSGYTLVELSVAVAVAGILVLASIAGVTSLIDQQRISDISVQNADAIERLNKAYAGLPSYNGLSLRQAVSFGAFSQFVINLPGTNNVTVTHPMGGAVGVAPLNGSLPLVWGLYLDAIPAHYCTDLLFHATPMSDALVVFPGGMSDPTGWSGNVLFNASVPAITVGAGLFSTAPIIAKNLTADLSPTSLAAACNFAGDRFGLLLLNSKLK